MNELIYPKYFLKNNLGKGFTILGMKYAQYNIFRTV